MRRVVLLGLAVLALTVVASGGSEAARVCEGDWHEYHVSGVKAVSIAWCGAAHFDGETAHTSLYGQAIHLNASERGADSHSVLMHELGHTIGYRHNSSSVMHPSHIGPDASECRVAPQTKHVAESFAGFRYLDWDTPDVLFVIEEWQAGETDTAQVTYAIQKWAAGTGCTDVYYDDGLFGPEGDALPTAGYFYGTPTIDCRIESWRSTNDRCPDAA